MILRRNTFTVRDSVLQELTEHKGCARKLERGFPACGTATAADGAGAEHFVNDNLCMVSALGKGIAATTKERLASDRLDVFSRVRFDHSLKDAFQDFDWQLRRPLRP
jgi:hypothetical protein